MGYKSQLRSRLLSSSTEVLDDDNGVVDTIDKTSTMRWVDVRTGGNNPMYFSKIKAGLGATNYLNAEKHDIRELQPGKMVMVVNQGRAKGQTGESTWLGINPELISASITDASLIQAENVAALKVRQKIRSVQQDMSGLTFLGELRESVKMIKKPAIGLENLLRKFIGNANPKEWKRSRKGIRKASKSHYLEDLGAMVLEVNFGLKPLVSDIQGIAEMMLPQVNVDDIRRVRGTGTEYDEPVFDFGHNSDMEARVYQNRVTISECDVTFIAGVRRKIECDALLGLSHLASRSFSLDDIVPTAWELLPWSFLIDYFSDIGDVLSANYLSMSNVAWSQRTRRAKTSKTVWAYQAIPYAPAYFGIVEFTPRVVQSSASWVERATADVPYVTARFELPSKRVQFANMLALLAVQKKSSF